MIITVAWTEQEQRVVRAGRYDVGFHTFETYRKPLACTWLLDGSSEDAAKAQAFIAGQYPDGQAFTFPSTEKDPLGESRRRMPMTVCPRCLNPGANHVNR